jgi:two-component system cell cycle sensor histidine kinase/response regulator CckA
MSESKGFASGRSLQLRALDFINDGVLICDQNMRVIYADPAMARILGCSVEVLAERALDEAVESLHFENALTLADVQKVLEETGVWRGEAEVASVDGQALHLDVRFRVLSDAEERRLGVLMVVRDITRERSLERQVLQSQQMELVENLSIGIAHEFKNLLTVIMAYASLLQEQTRGQPMEKDVVKILEAAQLANELTSRLVAVTRHSPPKLEDVDAFDIIKDVEAVLRKTLPRHVAFFVPERAKLPKIHTDPAILYRAILNLCLNARDAMPNGGNLAIETDVVRIEQEDVALYPDRTPGTYVTISVTDTGHGMTPDVKKRIFEPFFTTKKGGTGLGLSVVQHSIRGMGGWITVYSEPNLGSCFRVYIPAATAQHPPVVVEDSAPSTALPGGKERLLVVDDDPLALAICQRLLQRAGYTVHKAAGGEEAVQWFRQHCSETDLVLLDVVMPYMNGEEVYREMVRIQPDIKILLVSGFTPKTAERLIRISGAKFLSKPYSRAQLLQTVREALDQKK